MIDTKALREKVLDLAIRGKLVPQDPNDEPASVLLERIRQQKQQMVKEGKLKAKDIKNDTVIFVGEDNVNYAVGKNSRYCVSIALMVQYTVSEQGATTYRLFFGTRKYIFSNGA